MEHVMRYHRLIRSLALGSSLLALASVTVAQDNSQSPARKVSNWGYQAEGPEPKLPPAIRGERFDARDFSGAWETDHEGTNGFRSLTEEKAIPPRTPRGQEVYLGRKTARPHDGKKAVEPAFGNDPIMMCNPKGLLRLFLYTSPAEFIHTAKGDRILMTFQSQGSTRSIWMDGRALPVNPEPRWNGYSVGRWEGDTLVVDTRHFTDLEKHWVDQGIPASKDFRMIERYKLINNGNTLEGEWTLIDPQNWEGEWKGTRRWNRVTDHDIQEVTCLPDLNEHLQSTSSGVHIR
jgi:hypothetical protein